MSCNSCKLCPEQEQKPSTSISGLQTLLQAEWRYHVDVWTSSLQSWQLLHPISPSECERTTQGGQGFAPGLDCRVNLFDGALPSLWCQLTGKLQFSTNCTTLKRTKRFLWNASVHPASFIGHFWLGTLRNVRTIERKTKKLDRRWWYRKFSWEGGRIIFSWNAAVSFEMVTVIDYSCSGSSY